MMKKIIKMVGMMAAILISSSMVSTAMAATAVAQDDLLQDAGSWAQVVGEGSLKVVDPSLEKGRIWLEGQSRWDDNWESLVSRLFTRSGGLFAQ